MTELIDFLVWIQRRFKNKKIMYAERQVIACAVFEFLAEQEKEEKQVTHF